MTQEEFIKRARAAKSAGELIELAKENGKDLAPEDAEKFFSKINARSGEISDEEIEGAAGGIEILDDFLEACGDFWLSMFRPKHEEKEPPKPDSIGKDEFGFVTMR